MSKTTDPRRTEQPAFRIGDQVLVSAKNMTTRRSTKKLNHRYLGPFSIIKLIGERAVQLGLSKTMRCHNVFHVSLIEPYRKNSLLGRKQVIPDPIIVEEEDEYESEKILRAEWRKAKRGIKKWVEYLVQWKGYSIGDFTFETTNAFDKDNLSLLREFYKRNSEASRDQHLKL
jgi:hypothetical protein